MKFAKFFRTFILNSICEQLLLNLFKKRLENRCFPVNLVNYSRTLIKKLLRTAGSKTPVQGFLFNKVESLTAWRSLTVLERDSRAKFFFEF